MPKNSKSLELVLFHILSPNNKCHKGSHYPHLLNNHLFNYLNFSGLIDFGQVKQVQHADPFYELKLSTSFV